MLACAAADAGSGACGRPYFIADGNLVLQRPRILRLFEPVCRTVLMANKQQIDRIAQRIEALGRPRLGGPHLGVLQLPAQTVEEARKAVSKSPRTAPRAFFCLAYSAAVALMPSSSSRSDLGSRRASSGFIFPRRMTHRARAPEIELSQIGDVPGWRSPVRRLLQPCDRSRAMTVLRSACDPPEGRRQLD